MTLLQVLEALLFASPKPMTAAEFRAVLKSTAEFTEEPEAAGLARAREQDIADTLSSLAASYRQQERAVTLHEGASGWQLTTVTNCAPWVRQLFPENRPTRLSAPALETLAIIAYKQPVARAEVESVRGVDAGGVVQTLLDRGLIHIAGRAELPGRPLLYGTTRTFLEHFGLKEVSQLPAFEELKKSLAAVESRKAAAAQNPPPPERPLDPATPPDPAQVSFENQRPPVETAADEANPAADGSDLPL